MRSLFLLILFIYIGTTPMFSRSSSGDDPKNLIVAVDGPLSLLWKKERGTYHFYSKKNDELVELQNSTKNGKDLEDYKEVLKRHTENSVDIESVKLNLRSLTNFYVQYNRQLLDPNFDEKKSEHRLGFTGGVANTKYLHNPENTLHPTIALEYELSEAGRRRLFSLAFKLTHIAKSETHDYAALKLNLNYRLKVIRTSKLDIFVNTNIAEYNNSRFTYEIDDPEVPGTIEQITGKGSGFTSPLGLGLGWDWRIGKGYLSMLLNDAVMLNMETDNKFSLDLSLGYKLIL